MTADTDTLPTLPGHGGTADSPPSNSTRPEDRGRLRIADRVVERVAARAVSEIDAATGAPRRILGVTLGSADPDTQARVDAVVDGNIVMVRVAMAVTWPASIRAVTRQVRAHVIEQVERITGLQVAEVDIDVPTLLTEQRDTEPRVR